ncbi:DUF1839 family protein [Actinomycetes bacterium M1A6_2h]
MSVGAVRALEVDVDGYVAHAVHRSERSWTETNCYVDLWIELLHSLGADPLPAAAAVLASKFDGHQWTFLKFAPDDLRDLYGVEVAEMNVWRSVVDHVEEGLLDGRFLTVEVDSFWLPDTAGTSYRTEHTKTTVVPNLLDRAGRRMEYFHNAGYFELSADDFDGIWNLRDTPPEVLPPYVEQIDVDIDRLGAGPSAADADLAVVRRNLARRPPGNPVQDLALAVDANLGAIAAAGVATFHKWSFGMLRQCGAAAELASDLCDYLARRGLPVADSVPEFLEVAKDAKVVQFQLARVAYGRTGKVADPLARMVENWDKAMARLVGALVP